MSTHRTARAGALAIGALTVLLAAACSPPGSSAAQTGSGGSGPIKIAVVDAQSGSESDLGQFEYRGVKLAVSQLNAAGGIGGRKVQLTLFDDQGDPTVGTELARKIGSGGFAAMFGTAESSVTLAMVPILKSEHIPNITSGQSTQIVDRHSPYVFLNGPTGVTYDSTLAKYVVSTKKLTKIAMITNNGSYGAGEEKGFLAALSGLGIKPVASQVVPADQNNMDPALTAIRSKNPQVLFIGAEEAQSGLIVKQARALGMTATIAEGAPAGTPLYLSTAGAADANGTIVSSPYLGNDTTAAAKRFAAAYQAAYGVAPELHGAKAYDGAQIVLTALKDCHACTGLALANAIRGVHYQGLLGNFSYNSSGVGIFATSIGIVQNGKITPAG